jgi:ABC-type Zn uptake system ZnuABC Zn-binding protein ZnuA
MIKIFVFLILLHLNVNAKPLILTTNPVIKLITQEITASQAEIEIIKILPGQIMELEPSDLFKINAAEAIIYLSDSIETGVKNLNVKNIIQLSHILSDSIKLINNYGNLYDLYVDSLTYDITDSITLDSLNSFYYKDSSVNFYFFLDPIAVSNIATGLYEKLSELFPTKKAFFANNTERFKKRLILLDKQIEQHLIKLRGMPVYSQDVFLQYFLFRYNLQNTASIENPLDFGDGYLKFIKNDMEKIGSNVIFVHSDFENQIFENTNIKTIDVFALKQKYSSYADFILSITSEIKNSLLFY